MAISYRINQNGVNGTANRARRDIELSATAGYVTFEALSLGYTKYLWEILSCPPGASKDITNPTGTTVVYTVTHTGGYLIRLTVDDGLVTQDALVRYFGVPLERSRLLLPAQGEVDFDNSQDPYDGKDGLYGKMDAIYRTVDAIVADVYGEDLSIVVASGMSADGSIDLGVNQGVIYKVKVEVAAGQCDDADVKLGNADFSGSPEIVYQIGRTVLDEPIWVPDAGNWNDRNPLGFDNLTDGILYYRVTNNGSFSLTVNLLVRAQGVLV